MGTRTKQFLTLYCPLSTLRLQHKCPPLILITPSTLILLQFYAVLLPITWWKTVLSSPSFSPSPVRSQGSKLRSDVDVFDWREPSFSMLNLACLLHFRAQFQSQNYIFFKKALLCRHIASTRWHCFHFPQTNRYRASPWSQRLPLSCPAFPIRADLFGPKNRWDLCQSVHLVPFYQMEVEGLKI